MTYSMSEMAVETQQCILCVCVCVCVYVLVLFNIYYPDEHNTNIVFEWIINRH